MADQNENYEQADYEGPVDSAYNDLNVDPEPVASPHPDDRQSIHKDLPDEIRPGVIPHVLFVSRYRQGTTTEEEVRDLMNQHGKVRDIVFKTAVSFIEFERPEDAMAAKHALHRSANLGSDSIVVDFKKNNTGVKVSVNSSFWSYQGLLFILLLFRIFNPKKNLW
jgi:hypothetical protein